jgi:hypothetical protein
MTRARTYVAALCFAAVASVIAVVSAQQTRQPANPDHVKQAKEGRVCPKCDLRNGDFTGANLYGADLREANLEGAVFIETNLEMANLEGAVKANLAGAITDARTVCPDGNAGPCQQ